MNFSTYTAYFQNILTTENPAAPYDNPDYLNYVKLNWSRMNRWLKHGTIFPEAKAVIENISAPQNWVVITEPWCGDAAHSVPFLHMLSELNPLINVSYELRDSEPFQINNYLTNGSKSIPKWIIRDEDGNDLATWGPRPTVLQELHLQLKAENTPSEMAKTILQKWYNDDNGVTIQQEISALLKSLPVVK